MGAEIARALGLCLVFATEKICLNAARATTPRPASHAHEGTRRKELRSPARSQRATAAEARVRPTVNGGLARREEAEELDSDSDAEGEWDDADAFHGCEGVCVLTRLDVLECETILLPDASGKNDPCKQRVALKATLRATQRQVRPTRLARETEH